MEGAPMPKDKSPLREMEEQQVAKGQLCSECFGSEWVREDHPIQHERFGKLFPCSCVKKVDLGKVFDA